MGDPSLTLTQDQRPLGTGTAEAQRFCIICGRPAVGTLDDGREGKAYPLCPTHLGHGLAGVPLRALIWFE
jgi:hypothetical protein